ncbi:MAG: NAD-dependent epimerase/dehydratase family protein [Bacteroidales bacterium]
MNQKTAILLGSTGLTGSLLLKRLIADESYSTIKLFSRRPSGNRSPKIEEYIGDVLHLEHFKKDFTADDVFCCVGTTSVKTKDRTLYRAIDFGIPFAAAKLSRENNIPTYLVISSMGANQKSKIFYSRTKGEMEQAVLDQKIPNTYILRPSLILGDRNERRIGESIGAIVMKLTDVLLVGKLKKYRAIEADCVASAMIRLAKSGYKSQVVESDVIREFGRER